MPDITERVLRRVMAELRYASGMLCMYEERNRAYRLDLRIARISGDGHRCTEIVEDLAIFGVETKRLEAKQDSADRRLRILLGGEGFGQSA